MAEVLICELLISELFETAPILLLNLKSAFKNPIFSPWILKTLLVIVFNSF